MYTFFICIMWGFDGLAGGIVISIAKFREDFGTFYQGAYVVDADWQLGWLAGTLSGRLNLPRFAGCDQKLTGFT